jgi:hypothetical protein
MTKICDSFFTLIQSVFLVSRQFLTYLCLILFSKKHDKAIQEQIKSQ